MSLHLCLSTEMKQITFYIKTNMKSFEITKLLKRKQLDLEYVYLLARNMKYREFESEIGFLIDLHPRTVFNTNKYVLVNEDNVK